MRLFRVSALVPVLASVLLCACPEVAPPLEDAGSPGDAGSSEPDSGAPVLDAGPGAPDGGAPVLDAGSGVPDGGAPAPDGGAPAVDGGGGSVDAGTPGADAGPPLGDLNVAWVHGAACDGADAEPPLQVHAYNADTYILRQSMCTNFEGPFLYLLFGATRALLLDTGASSSPAVPVRSTVEQIITEHLAGAPRSGLELVVAHTHGHGDHVAGDGAFAGQPYTTVVSADLSSVESFFGFTSWPEDAVTFDLGGRVLDVLPIPGHHPSHVAYYDRASALLLTGDTLYPGFLFIPDWNTYRASIARLATFAANVPVSWVLGTHIEMTSAPGQAYPYGTDYQPAERALQLTRAHLDELDAALTAIGASPTSEVHDDFILSP